MLSVQGLTVRRKSRTVLDNVMLTLAAGQTLAVIGESGAGKSTLVAAILGLMPYQAGHVTWQGRPVRDARPELEIQEPRAAFNPALRFRRSVMEPLAARRTSLCDDRLAGLCKGLELDTALLDRRPAEVSIGQAQRMGILRALVADPPLLVLDEPLSALDAVTQKHTARLIAAMQREQGFSMLIVTHDLGYAAAYADQVVILRHGRIAEAAAAPEFFRAPQSDYGCALCDAAFALGALERAA